MIACLDLRTIARRLGGEVSGKHALVPGPGHSPGDRSLSIRLSHQSPTGWITYSYAGDRFDVCRDYVAARLGIAPDAWKRPQDAQQRPVTPSPAPNNDAARTARATAVWHEARDPRGTVVETYLRGRGLDLDDDVAGAVLRFHPRCPWRDEELNRTVYIPAMVTVMRSIATDKVQAIQRTRLTPEGGKVARRMLGPAGGAAIKLDADADVTHGLAIGEGCETALAARQIGIRPCWALGSAGAVASFPILPGIEALTLLAENDEANHKAVEACAGRWHAAGREVIVVEPASGSDILDAMRGAA